MIGWSDLASAQLLDRLLPLARQPSLDALYYHGEACHFQGYLNILSLGLSACPALYS